MPSQSLRQPHRLANASGPCPGKPKTLSAEPGAYVVEVCWLRNGLVHCRRHLVWADSAAGAARTACRELRRALGWRAGRVEAVEVESVSAGCGHE